MKTTLFAMLVLAGLAQAQTATRLVTLSWTASTSAGVTGYNIYRCTSPCSPAVTMAPLNAVPVTGTSFIDNMAVVGQTYTYGATAVAPACTPVTPVTAVCGTSDMSVPTSVTIPIKPAAIVTETVTVQ